MASVERLANPNANLGRVAVEVVPPAMPPARFDRVARIYRPMEYLSFGPMLERCRFHHIPGLTHTRRALVLGDGDGRFVARLLAAAPDLHVDAVDSSSGMLRLLRHRVAKQGNLNRLTTICADARTFIPKCARYDLIATNFFLDCLTESEAANLMARIRPHLAPGARWLVSEFQILDSNLFQRSVSRMIVSGLYAAFGVMTRLRVRQIPPWRALLAHNSFAPIRTNRWLGGLLVSELWEL
jgi:ubiquinone/menaquinone biosynthesis C-methylase UbiE